MITFLFKVHGTQHTLSMSGYKPIHSGERLSDDDCGYSQNDKGKFRRYDSKLSDEARSL